MELLTTLSRIQLIRILSLSLLAILFSASAISGSPSHPQQIDLVKRDDLCGNGILDAGEECDFGVAGSESGCCTKACKKAAAMYTTCAAGKGVCDASGACITRSNQCSALDGKLLSINKSLAVQGPYSPCTFSAVGNSVAKQENMDCTLNCGGTNVANGTFTCLALADYTNVVNIIADGASCSSKGAPGVCMSGACATASCSKYRCNNNGNCVLSGNAVKCECKPNFSGDDCSITPGCDGHVDSCGVCNGDHTKCSSTSDTINFLKSDKFLKIILPSICGVLLLLLIASLVYFMRSRKKKPAPSFNVVTTSHSASPSTVGTLAAVSSPGTVDKKQAVLGVSVKFDEFKVVQNYEPVMSDELELQIGDVLFKLFEYDDGWAKGYNTRSGQEGVYPVGFTERVVAPKPASPSVITE